MKKELLKELLISLGCLLGLVGVVIAQEITITSADKFYKYAYAVIEKYRIGMEAVISYTKEIGKDASQLTSIKNEFLSAGKELETACNNQNWSEINSIASKMKDNVTAFREEAQTQLVGHGKEAKERIEKAIEENKNYLNSLLNEARKLHRERNLQIFDFSVAKAKEVTERLKDYKLDTTEVNSKLSEIEGKRSNFIAAMDDVINACTGYWWLECEVQEVVSETPETSETECKSKVRNYCTLRDEIRKDFQDLQDLVYKAAGY